jgi:hypothetical protein
VEHGTAYPSRLNPWFLVEFPMVAMFVKGSGRMAIFIEDLP